MERQGNKFTLMGMGTVTITGESIDVPAGECPNCGRPLFRREVTVMGLSGNESIKLGDQSSIPYILAALTERQHDTLVCYNLKCKPRTQPTSAGENKSAGG
jgi:hypothetical protein